MHIAKSIQVNSYHTIPYHIILPTHIILYEPSPHRLHCHTVLWKVEGEVLIVSLPTNSHRRVYNHLVSPLTLNHAQGIRSTIHEAETSLRNQSIPIIVITTHDSAGPISRSLEIVSRRETRKKNHFEIHVNEVEFFLHFLGWEKRYHYLLPSFAHQLIGFTTNLTRLDRGWQSYQEGNPSFSQQQSVVII